MAAVTAKNFRIALVQLAVTADKALNLANARTKVRRFGGQDRTTRTPNLAHTRAFLEFRSWKQPKMDLRSLFFLKCEALDR